MYSLTFHVRVTTPPAEWTKCNGLVADNVAHAAGASILSLVRSCMRSACGVQWAWWITTGLCHTFLVLPQQRSPCTNCKSCTTREHPLPLPQVTSGSM